MKRLRMLCAATLAACALATPVWAEDYPTTWGSQSSSRSDRYLSSITVSSDGQQVLSTAVSTSGYAPLYYDKTGEVVTVEAGSTLKVVTNYTGVWMHSYVYIDLNGDKQFSYGVDQTNHKALAGSELCSFSGWSFNAASEDPVYNSDGTKFTGDSRSTLDLPSFTAPSTPGTYRMRVKVDWNNIDPAGSGASNKGGSMKANGGVIVDLTLNVTSSSTSQTAPLPYDVQSFVLDYESAKSWKATDANNDGKTWSIKANCGGFIMDPYTLPNPTSNDDYLRSPLFSLQGGKSYRIGWSLQAVDQMAEGDGKLELVATSDGKSEDLSNIAFPKRTAEGLVTGTCVFVPSVSGDYSLSFHYTSTNQQPKFSICGFSIKADSLLIPISTPEGYATYYNADAYTVPEGLEATTVSGYAQDADGYKLTMDWEYQAGQTVPAKTAVLLRRTDSQAQGTAVAQLSDVAGDQPATNLLHGANAVADGKTYVEATNGGTVKYYVFSYKAGTGYDGVKGEDLGFYWAAANGAAVTFDATKNAHRAFLAVEYPSEADAVKGFSFDLHPTDITAVVSDEAGQQPAAIYTLTGRRVNAASLQGLDKGIYIFGGKKVLVK